MALERELAYYERHRNELLEHEGKFVVIHGEEVNGFWGTLDDALQAGCREFGLRPFLVRKVMAVEPVHFIRGLPACPS